MLAPCRGPQEGLRYVNPLVMENAGRLADPTVIKVGGSYYLYLTGGVSPGRGFGAAVWASDDLVRWEHHEVSIEGGRGVVAPTAFEYEGYVYLTGNDIGLFRSRDPLGPFEFFGDFVDEHGHRLHSAIGGQGLRRQQRGARRYKIEVSADGEAFTTVVDKTGNSRDNAVEFNAIVPVEARYVRLTLTGWPQGLPVGVLEFTVFGRPLFSPRIP